jgi:hypothetical protein
VLLFVLMVACTDNGTSSAPTEINAIPASGTQLPPGSAQLSAPGLPVLDTVPERPLYIMNVTLDYTGNTVHTQERVEFRNPTGGPVDEIVFNVPPAHHAGIIDVRDARIFGQPQPLTFVLTNTVLTVQLPAALPEQAGIAIAFDFVLRIPLQEMIVGIGGDDSSRGLYSLTGGHWYIMLAPYDNGAWDTPDYIPIGDPYVSELADYDVTFLAPDNVVIAGAGDEQHDGRLWHYSLPQARVFAFGASDVYQVDTLQQDGITYVHYAYPPERKYADAVLNTAARAIRLYSQLYGPTRIRRCASWRPAAGKGRSIAG